MRLKIISAAPWIFIIGLMFHGAVVNAAEPRKTDSYLPRYNILKTNTSVLLDSLRHDRMEGRPTKDRRPLLQLRKEVMDFCFEARREGHLQKVAHASTPGAEVDQMHLLALAYACEAMEQVLEAEWDALQNGQHNSSLLHEIQVKYEEVWKVADHLVSGPPQHGAMTR